MRSGAGRTWITLRKQLVLADRRARTSPDVLKTFDASGSLVAYQDAPAFSDFVATDSARLIAAIRKIGRVE